MFWVIIFRLLVSILRCLCELGLWVWLFSMLLGCMFSLYYLNCFVSLMGLRMCSLYRLFGLVSLGVVWVGIVLIVGMVVCLVFSNLFIFIFSVLVSC